MAIKRLLLMAVLLALLAVGVKVTSDCAPQYKLILADGEEFELFGHGRAPGSGAGLVPLDGHDGLTSLSHVSDDIYGVPGKLLASVSPDMRIVTLTASLYSLDGTQRDLLRAKGALMDGLRWDRGDRDKDPITLRANLGDDSWDLGLNYQSLVESRQGRHGLNEAVAVRLAAYDPTWKSTTESSLTLDWADDLTVRYVMARESGLWNAMGPPAAVALGPGGSTAVYAIAVDPNNPDHIYVAGDFDNWDNLGVGVGSCVVMWDRATGTWSTVGGGLNAQVYRLYFGPDGTLYAVGAFTDGSGGAGDLAADCIAQLDTTTDTWVNVYGGPGAGAANYIYDMVIGFDQTLYIIGDFTNWQGTGANHICTYDPSIPNWVSIGSLNNPGRSVAIAPTGDLIACGTGTTFGGVVCNYVAEWDGTAWTDLDSGTNGTVMDVAFTPDGLLYATGVFTTAGGNTVNGIAVWNGSSWRDLDGGFNIPGGRRLNISDDGEVYACGSFTVAGSVLVADHFAKWNGFSWSRLDTNNPAAGNGWEVVVYDGDVYIGLDAAGTAVVAGGNTLTDAGSAPSYPTIEIKNECQVWSIGNETTGEEILFAPMQIFDGEIVEITTNKRTGRDITSTWRPLGRLGDLLPPGMGDWKLESGPRAAYAGVDGANLVTVFITDADPREHNDGGNQLSGWDDITGISQDNTDLGRLYASIVVVGGGFNRVDFYMDAARTQQVAETDPYNAPGAEPILEVNDSGLGGTITIDAVGAGDVDIYARYTIVTATWYNRWWSLSEAVRDAVT